MNNDWKIKYLNDILELNVDAVAIDPTSSYKFAGVYCFGKGLFEREELLGANTSYKCFNRLHKDHITISKVKGWEGAIALIDENYEGMFLSPQYPTFRVKDKKETEIKYVEKFLMQEKIWKELLGKSVGIGARRNSISEGKILNLSIPHPPLPEQKRIVAILDSVKNRIDEIKRLRQEQEKEIENFRNSFFANLQNKYDNVPIGKVLRPNKQTVNLDLNAMYKQVTVKMEHKGVILRGLMQGCDIGSNQFLAKEGNFIISKIDARNGAMGMIPPELDGAIVTNDFPLYGFEDNVNPLFFYYFSNTYYFDNACKNASEGTTNRKRLKMDKFENILIPLPLIEEQNRIVETLNKFKVFKTHNQQNQEELDQLMPSLMDKAFKGEL